ncbi:helix-turn-helix domain-containing protein [Cohaesibacter sp. ES.047]|uniref:helix-turn-helix domain-containing protein n=1 Tax=Cohaesibacter sp. ES.047 TaxID=1798205 RepID=UPI000BB96668|nr:helix-turn-helix domain-containing protein [Cohaesibacter sp. ES.047]
MPCYSHLSIDEREQISTLRHSGHSIGSIGELVGRSKSTISRELSRNRLPSGRYSPSHADGSYLLRRQRLAILEDVEKLGQFVRDRLSEGWMPEQIAGWLKAGNEKVCALYALKRSIASSIELARKVKNCGSF